MDSKEQFWYGLLVGAKTTIEQQEAKLAQYAREANEQGLSLRWIAEQIDVSHETVRRMVTKPPA